MKQLLILILSTSLIGCTGFEATYTDQASKSEAEKQDITILKSPLSRQVYTNSSISLSVEANSKAELQYTWKKDGAILLGQNFPVLNLLNIQMEDAGSYEVSVFSENNRVESQAAQIGVAPRPSNMQAPTLLSESPSSNINFGESLTLMVNAIGNPHPSYQWYKNGQPLSGETADFLYIESASQTDAGIYSLEISNSEGLIRSSSILVGVNQPIVPPQIFSFTDDSSISIGGNISLSADATGLPSLVYRWYKDGILLADENQKSLNITNATASSAGRYEVRVSNGNMQTSANMNLSVISDLQILTELTSQTLSVGQMANFSVNVDGQVANYTWFKNNVAIAGANAANYSISNVIATDAGEYKVRATSPVGNFLESTAILTIIGPPSIIAQPQNRAAFLGDMLNFSVQATGIGLTYQWQKDGANLPGETMLNLNLSNVQNADAGSYRVIVNTAGGSITSNPAILTINAAPVIGTGLSSLILDEGAQANFNIMASGQGLTYQWQKDNMIIPGANTASYTINSVQTTDQGEYKVIVSNGSGFAESTTSLTVLIELNGNTLYAQNCAGCHGAVENSAKRNRSFQTIKDSLSNVGTMANIFVVENGLTLADAQIQAITNVLTDEINTENLSLFSCNEADETPLRETRRLSSYETTNIYTELFGSDLLQQDSVNLELRQLTQDFDGTLFDTRNTADQHFETLFNLAFEVSQYVAQTPSVQTRIGGNCLAQNNISQQCFTDFILNFGQKVFRKPVSITTQTKYQGIYTELNSDKNALLTNVITSLMSSPQFTYVLEIDGQIETTNVLTLNDHELATRLSLMLWGSLPDFELMNAAGQGELQTQAGLENQARRMIASSKAKTHFQQFAYQWLRPNMPSAEEYPDEFLEGFNTENLEAEYKLEFDEYLNNIVWTERGNYNNLMTSRTAFVHSNRMSSVLGVSNPGTASGRVTVSEERGGLLSRPYFLSRSGEAETSPIMRGLLVKQDILCGSISDPADEDLPPDALELPEAVPGLSTRRRVEQATAPAACNSCHAQFNGFGFALELFDDLGRARTFEKIFDSEHKLIGTANIDTAAEMVIRAPANSQFDNATEMQKEISDTGAGQQCFVKKWFEYTEHSKAESHDNCHLNSMVKGLTGPEGNSGSIQDMLIQTINGRDFKVRKFE